MQNTVKVHDIRIRIKNVRETKSGKIEITTIHGKPWNEGCFHEADRRDNRRNDDCAEGDGEKEDLHSILIHETTAAEDVGEEVLKHATEGDTGAEDFMVTMATKLNKGSKLYRVESANAPRRYFGHARKNEENMKDRCLRCCEPRHKTRNCKNEPHCVACDQKGHG
jgi:hypothetical protein